MNSSYKLSSGTSTPVIRVHCLRKPGFKQVKSAISSEGKLVCTHVKSATEVNAQRLFVPKPQDYRSLLPRACIKELTQSIE